MYFSFRLSLLVGFLVVFLGVTSYASVGSLPGEAGNVVALKKTSVPKGDVEAWVSEQGFALLPNYSNRHGVFRLEPSPSLPSDWIVQRCLESGLFEFAEPDMPIHATALPNDVGITSGQDWAKHNVGLFEGVVDADIDGPEAWDLVTDAPDVLIAIIDSGLRVTHEDLVENVWRNAGEVPGNGKDDDGNGVVDDVHGFSAITQDGRIQDGDGHGTSVAGVIAAKGNNGVGTAGVVWSTQLLIAKFLDDQGNGSTAGAVDCIHYCLDNGVDIINASWGGSRRSRALDTALARAESMGVPVVVAAGNSGANTDRGQHYPASYRYDNMIVVGASTNRDVRMPESNYGNRSVDLFAPGAVVLTCSADSDSAYRFSSGTSLAAPYVTGALALLLGLQPEATSAELFATVISTVDSLPGLPSVAQGRLNLRQQFSF